LKADGILADPYRRDIGGYVRGIPAARLLSIGARLRLGAHSALNTYTTSRLAETRALAAVGLTQDSTRSSARLLLLDPVPTSPSSHCKYDRTGDQADYPTDNGGRNPQLKDSEPGSLRVHQETNHQPGDAASSSCTYGADDKKPRENRKPHHGCDCAHAGISHCRPRSGPGKVRELGQGGDPGKAARLEAARASPRVCLVAT
jgi:hypothetical protein